jgi:hypothetical protein
VQSSLLKEHAVQHEGIRVREGLQFNLVVSMSRESGWRAAVVGPDDTERVFVSPFELARYLAWPAASVSFVLQGGVR